MSDNAIMGISELRRQNVRLIINTMYEGVDAALARDLSIMPQQVARWFSGNPEHRRNIGPKYAKRICEICDLEEGWLDIEHVEPLFDQQIAKLKDAYLDGGKEDREYLRKSLELLVAFSSRGK